MRRLLTLLLLVPLVALAQPDEGECTLDLSGLEYPGSDGPTDLTGIARFGGAATGADLPQGTNSVLTCRTLNRTVVTLFSKDVYRPGFSSSNRSAVTQNTGTTAYAPRHEVVSGDPEDFHALSLFDYGLRIELPDGRTFYSIGRPGQATTPRLLTIDRSRDVGVEGRTVVQVREAGAQSASGSVTIAFHATPSDTPSPGLQPGQALVVVTGEKEMMVTVPATWGRGYESSDCAGCDPWILRLGLGGGYGGGMLNIQGVRPADAPNSMAGIGWGGFRPGANGQLPSGFVRDAMMYDVQFPGETQTWYSAGQPGKPVDLHAPLQQSPYSFGGSNGLSYARIHANGSGYDEDERSYAGWTDFHAWKAKLNPLPREVRAVARVSARYHTTAGDSPAPDPSTGFGMGGSFTASVDGLRMRGVASIVEGGGVFSLSMSGGAPGSIGGTFSFGGRGEPRERTFRYAEDAPPGANEVVGTFSGNGGGVPMSCVFQPGSARELEITNVTDETVEGTFSGTVECRDQYGGVYPRTVTGGEFEAARAMPGGQINLPDPETLPTTVSMPSCIDVPPGVTLPANSPIPACD